MTIASHPRLSRVLQNSIPQNPEAHLELAKVDFTLNKFLDAEVQARTAIKLKEPKPGVYVVLGYSLLRQKKAEEARRAFQQFLKINPSGPMAVIGRA